jgi:hypothetical protein
VGWVGRVGAGKGNGVGGMLCNVQAEQRASDIFISCDEWNGMTWSGMAPERRQ